MNMLARWILGLAIGFGLLLANTGLTSAYYFGSRWHWVNGSSCCLNLNYANTMDTTQAYGTEFDQGATDWSGTASPPYLNKVSYGSGQVITGRGYSDTNPNIGGYTSIYATVCISSSCSEEELSYSNACANPCYVYDSGGSRYLDYTRSTIEINRTGFCTNPGNYGYTWSNYSCFNADAVHELGHALGLAHAPCTGPIMYHALQDGIKKPQSMDISDINQLYQNANWSPGKTTC